MIIQVKQGKLRGIESTTILSGHKYYSFSGIPYAAPPSRFQPPEPAENWTGIRDASFERDVCIQQMNFMMDENEVIGSEDCLFLNVYTPMKLEGNEGKPVMVYIHGGAFYCLSGSKSYISPDYLIEHDVILVTMNYRLHAMGFLNLDLSDCRGNMGLKDQRLALIWIKENIRAFGGDPENITLFGGSAGSSAVNLHMISPASKGLFNKAIMQSGTVFCPWGFIDPHVEYAFQLGHELGFAGSGAEELLVFLKNQDAADITRGTFKLMKRIGNEKPGGLNLTIFLPSVELLEIDAFLPDTPTNLSKIAEPVPLIVGKDNKEGSIALYFSSTKQIAENPIQLIEHNLKGPSDEEIQNVFELIKEFYFGEQKVGIETVDKIIDLYSDIIFKDFYKSFDFVTKSDQPVFVYDFKYDGGLNTSKIFQISKATGIDDLKGAGHADDFPYTLYTPTGPVPTDPKDLQMVKQLCTLWTNFAKTGKPTDNEGSICWTQYTLEEPRFLEIGDEIKLIEGRPDENRIEFWDKLKKLYTIL